MKIKNLLPVLAIFCSLASCSTEKNTDNDGPLFKEPCVQWGASRHTVKSYMSVAECTLVEEFVEENNEYWLIYTDIRTRNLLPYTVMYEYSSNVEEVYNPETMETIEVDEGLWASAVTITGTTKQQQEKLNEEFIAFFEEKYNEVPLSSVANEDWIYQDGTYISSDEDLTAEVVGAYVNDKKTVCVVVGIIKKMEGNIVNDWIMADYSYEF